MEKTLAKIDVHENMEAFLNEARNYGIKKIYYTTIPNQKEVEAMRGEERIKAVKVSVILNLSACTEDTHNQLIYQETIADLLKHDGTTKEDVDAYMTKANAKVEEVIKVFQKDYPTATLYVGSTNIIRG